VQQCIQKLVHVLEKDIDLHNHAYSTVLKKFREVFELDKRAVQVVSAGFHSYCQTEHKRLQILQTDPKHLHDFAASFVKQSVFTDDICKAYERLANSPVADHAWVTMLQQQTSEPPPAYTKRTAMKAFARRIMAARQSELQIGECLTYLW
jgi:hypothetical protein